MGITFAPFQLISDWMSGGDLLEYIEKNSDADRLELVRAPQVVSVTLLPPLPAIRRC
jgi:hypothetical protein